jgi:hypothetical protein
MTLICYQKYITNLYLILLYYSSLVKKEGAIIKKSALSSINPMLNLALATSAPQIIPS